jgi:nitrate reductase gamma subunit
MQHEPSNLLATAEVIHWIALVVMAAVYTLRLRWLFSFKAAKDKSAPGNPSQSNAKLGARYSLLNVFMPWGMESTRKGFGFYLTFVLFHLGVVVGISLAFLSTVALGFLRLPAVFFISEALLITAFVIGLYRILRRVLRPVMRLISTPDDYFSLTMLTFWFALGAVTEASIYGVSTVAGEGYQIAYLLLTSFFLLYVPFSKISHYLYYPFTRIWIGRALGHRGSYPYSRG